MLRVARDNYVIEPKEKTDVRLGLLRDVGHMVAKIVVFFRVFSFGHHAADVVDDGAGLTNAQFLRAFLDLLPGIVECFAGFVDSALYFLCRCRSLWNCAKNVVFQTGHFSLDQSTRRRCPQRNFWAFEANFCWKIGTIGEHEK